MKCLVCGMHLNHKMRYKGFTDTCSVAHRMFLKEKNNKDVFEAKLNTLSIPLVTTSINTIIQELHSNDRFIMNISDEYDINSSKYRVQNIIHYDKVYGHIEDVKMACLDLRMYC